MPSTLVASDHHPDAAGPVTGPAQSRPDPHLPLGCYRLGFRAPAGLALTEDPRGLWHGVFGASLRRAVCLRPGIECPACPLLHHCPYSTLFSGPRPPTAELMRAYDRIPVPHVFVMPPGPAPRLAPGGRLQLGVTLIGRANEQLSLVIRALADAGRAGLGAARAPLDLDTIEQLDADGGHARSLFGADGRPAAAAPPGPPRLPALDGACDRLRLSFITPYKPGGRGADPDAFDPPLLLMAIVRRISLLQYFYTGVRLDADFAALKAAAGAVQVRARHLERERVTRYGARHGRRVDQSGLTGHLDLAIDPALRTLWPYLHLGQWLNVGKNASMGFGAYRLDLLGDAAHGRG